MPGEALGRTMTGGPWRTAEVSQGQQALSQEIPAVRGQGCARGDGVGRSPSPLDSLKVTAGPSSAQSGPDQRTDEDALAL